LLGAHLLYALYFPCSAKDFGVQGETFVIEEENILHVIQKKLQVLEESGDLKKHQQQITSQAQQRLRRPVILQGFSGQIC
jgi:conjugal transfer pilus assembly protein TraW